MMKVLNPLIQNLLVELILMHHVMQMWVELNHFNRMLSMVWLSVSEVQLYILYCTVVGVLKERDGNTIFVSISSHSIYIHIPFPTHLVLPIPILILFNSFNLASLVGATGNNDFCGVGIAPRVTFSSCSTQGFMSNPELLSYKLDQMDISQNSWAIEGCGQNAGFDPERSLQEIGVETSVPTLVTECPFVYKPFDGYAFYPCDKCTLFQNKFDIDNDIEIDLMGQDCVDAVEKHCDWYYAQEQKICVEYLDLILDIRYPSTRGECNFKTVSDAGREALSRGV